MTDDPSTPHVEVRKAGHTPGTPVPQPLDLPGTDAGWRDLQADQRDERTRNPGELLLPTGAGWVEHDTLGVADEVARRWDNLRVAQCQQRCDDCTKLGHFPYVVCELTRSGQTVPVLGFLKLDRQVVDTLWAISQSAGDQQRLADEHNDRVRAELERRSAEEQQAALEVIGAALQSHKYDWRGPGGIKIGRHMDRGAARRAISQN